jgi:hypothetical protein
MEKAVIKKFESAKLPITEEYGAKQLKTPAVPGNALRGVVVQRGQRTFPIPTTLGSAAGVKTVQVEYRDAGGHASPVAQDTIRCKP